MKIGKTSAMVFGAGAFIVLAGILGRTYSQLRQDQTDLKAQLSQTNSRIATVQIPVIPESLISQKKALETFIATAQTQFDGAKASLKQPLDSIEMTATLARLATASGVTLTDVNSPGISDEKLGGFPFSQLSLDFKAEGEVSNLIQFTFLVGKQFPTDIITSSEIIIPDKSISGPNPQLPSVSLALRIYSYEDPNG